MEVAALQTELAGSLLPEISRAQVPYKKRWLALLAPALILAAPPTVSADWLFWGGDTGNTRNAAAETTIGASNVAGLKAKWTYQAQGDISATPTVENDDLYITDWGGYVHKLNRLTGALLWKHKLSEYTGSTQSVSRSSPAIAANVVVIGDRTSGTILALSKDTGALAWKYVADTDPTAMITGSPLVYNGVVYAGVSSGAELRPGTPSFRGSVVALDAASGALLWQFRTVPQGYTGGAVWSSTPVIDTQRGALYITTGNNYSIPAAVQSCVNGTSDPAAQRRCMAPDNYIDAVVSLDLNTGQVKWAHLVGGADAWVVGCKVHDMACDVPASPDYDFGSGVNFINTPLGTQLLGAGQKSGIYWALDPDDGHTVWATQAGPGDALGGILWGSATDGTAVYVADANGSGQSYTLADGTTWSAGDWSALDAATGKVLWQVPQAGGGVVPGVGHSEISPPLTVANGVLYAGSQDGTMSALDAASGRRLWQFASGGEVMSGPSIVGGMVYWGSGYTHGAGMPSHKLYAFALP